MNIQQACLRALMGTISFAILAGLACHASERGGGIHPIGENAVYLAGEACVVNMGTERRFEDIYSDFEACAELHSEFIEESDR